MKATHEESLGEVSVHGHPPHLQTGTQVRVIHLSPTRQDAVARDTRRARHHRDLLLLVRIDEVAERTLRHTPPPCSTAVQCRTISGMPKPKVGTHQALKRTPSMSTDAAAAPGCPTDPTLRDVVPIEEVSVRCWSEIFNQIGFPVGVTASTLTHEVLVSAIERGGLSKEFTELLQVLHELGRADGVDLLYVQAADTGVDGAIGPALDAATDDTRGFDAASDTGSTSDLGTADEAGDAPTDAPADGASDAIDAPVDAPADATADATEGG